MKLHSIDYKDWYINQKRVPVKGSDEYKNFYAFHKELCMNGFLMDGVYINSFLYWHLNFWNTEVDVLDEYGRINQKYANPNLRDNEWLVTNEIDRAQKERKGLVILGIRRFAKALRNNELLYNQEGSYLIGDAKIGDTIFDHGGKLTNITGVFPQGKIPVYKMSLEDGREIVCCENHIWRVLDRRNGRSVKDLSIKKLLPIYKNSRVHNGYKNSVTRNIEECFFAIPNNKCVEYSEKELSIDPYFLGLWLGDGHSRMPSITTTDETIKDYVYHYADSLGLKVRVEKDVTYYITSGLKGGTLDYNILLTKLKELNLIKNKHIPIQYLLSGKEQRLALLQGLMDTDGSVYSNGTISFTTTKEQLAKDFFSLCRSLGINLTKKKFIPKLYGKNCGEGWLFTLFTEAPIFRLERKLSRIKYNNKGKQSKINWTTIRNIELIGEEDSTCITVDNKDKLFLTTDYTVTHNSVIESSYIGQGATFDENSQNVIAGLNAPDIKLITDKIDKGLNFLPEAWKWQRVEDNWKNQVTLGIKTKSGERIPFSQILIRNLDGGNNEEAIAGTKPRRLIIDEIGKGSFLRGLQAAIPGFQTPFGWGCSPILTGCVCAGTKVWNNLGELINIETLTPDQGILGFDITNQELSKENITYWQVPHEKHCYKIITNSNRELECSDDHPILFRSRNETYGNKPRRGQRKIYFKETKSLNLNDQIAIVESIDIWGNKKMFQPRLIGMLIGDGSYGFNKTPILSNCDKELNDFVENNFETVLERSYITKDNRIYKETRIKNICQELRQLGIYGQTKNKKTLPLNIDTFCKEDICELLGGFFDTDGCVSVTRTGGIIKLTSAYKNLLTEVFYLLQKLGIHASISFKKPRANNKLDKNGWYDLLIADRKSINCFKENIKLYVNYKQNNLLTICEKLKNKKNQIPKEVNNIRFESIRSIEYIGIKPVYNLTADTTHTYIANGIITHNTGGDMKMFMDAKSLMFDVQNFNFLEYNNSKDEKRIHGLFISNKYRMEAKIESSLGSFLEMPKTSTLHEVKMLVSDEELATKILDENLEKLKRAGDRIAFLKEKMYFPKEVDDIFLNEDTNIFDIEAVKRQKARLLSQERTGTAVVLYDDGNGVKHSFSDKLPISNFPLKNADDKDAPVIIYEFPMEDPPYGLYVAGVDPYRQGKAAYSTSLGSVYIYKRMTTINGEKYQDMFVASYCARPDKKETWEEQARYLIKYYNARTLCENDEISFIDYMISKNDAHYLERQPDWLKEIVPNTTVRRDYGIHRSAEKIRDFLHGCLKKYSESVIFTEKDNDGVIISETKGMSKIFDPLLLEEMIQYNEDGNFDRIIAAELAIALAMKLDPIFGAIGGGNSGDRIKSLSSPKKSKMFSQSRGLFNNKGKLFR